MWVLKRAKQKKNWNPNSIWHLPFSFAHDKDKVQCIALGRVIITSPWGRPSPWEPTQDQLAHSRDWLGIIFITYLLPQCRHHHHNHHNGHHPFNTSLVTWKCYFLPPLFSKQCQPLKASNCSKCKSLTRIKAKACLSIKWFHQPLKLVTAWGQTLTEPTNSDENPVELPNKWNSGSSLLWNAIMEAWQKFP